MTDPGEVESAVPLQAQLLRYAADLARVCRSERAERSERCRSGALYRGVLQGTREGIMVLDTAGLILDVNETFAHRIESRPSDVRGLHAHDIEPLASLLDELSEAGEGTRTVIPGSATEELHLEVLPLRDPSAEHLGWICFVREPAPEGTPDRMKREFLAVVSHELRTPLTAITGFASILDEKTRDRLSEDEREMLLSIANGAEDLRYAIEKILTFTSVAGAEAFTPREIDLRKTARKSVARAQSRATASQVSLQMEAGTGSTLVHGDLCLLTSAIDELVRNAIDFNTEGGEARVVVSSSDRGVQLRVSDTGPGIRPENVERIFEPFFREQDSLRMTTRGLGLGLALVHRVASLHEGSIDVQTGDGKGTTITLTLPPA